MKPLFFGRSDAPLYGVFHPPQLEQPRTEAILLCNAFGQEYMRAHRAFRQVANLLSRAGYAVMRFDYSCTGDSAGDGESARVEQWIEDIGLAIDELRAMARVSRVSLVGLRLGANLAAATAAQRSDISRLVLWDPPLSGADYISELIDYLQVRAEKRGDALDPERLQQEGFYMNGFPLMPPLLTSLQSLDLTTLPSLQVSQTLLVVSHESPQFERLQSTLSQQLLAFNYQLAPSPGNWNFVDNFGGVLIPHAIIQAIVSWFQSER